MNLHTDASACASARRDKNFKEFYNGFRHLHHILTESISGIDLPSPGMARRDRMHYTSLIFKRIIFLYFIQKRGFLDDDEDYLHTRYSSFRTHFSQDETDPHDEVAGRKTSFYRKFLRPLFHDVLDKPERNAEKLSFFGRIPYLGGSIFEAHRLELAYPEIDVRDEAVELILNFFDEWHWSLDESDVSIPCTVTPLVIEYIFEKHIDYQEEAGAYYTGRDIAVYMARSCILPRLFDMVEERVPGLFSRDGSLARLIRESHTNYLHDSMAHGHTSDWKSRMPESKRSSNSIAPDDLALPTETWRECAARFQRVEEILDIIREDGIRDIDDFLILNLDINRFTMDLLSRSEDGNLIRAFADALERITVLDPTCGSGVFLFAALDILLPLREICERRLSALVRSGEVSPGNEDVGSGVGRYDLCHRILQDNLYGVDIKIEAVETTKLRLLLRLLSYFLPDTGGGDMALPPLPDLDLNVRCGNSLVGCTHEPDNEVLYDIGADTGSPFHWYSEFPKILCERGGFDVILGNPPYLEYPGKKVDYRVKELDETGCDNLYAACIARSYEVGHRDARISYIVPVGITCVRRMVPLRSLMLANSGLLLFANFDDRPSRLFEMIQHMRATVFIASRRKRQTNPEIYVTGFRRWYHSMRPHLFDTLRYVRIEYMDADKVIPKLSSPLDREIDRLLDQVSGRMKDVCVSGKGSPVFYRSSGGGYYLLVKPVRSLTTINGEEEAVKAEKTIYIRNEVSPFLISAILSSSLFYRHYISRTDCRNLTKGFIMNFPLPSSVLSDSKLIEAGEALSREYEKNKIRKEAYYRSSASHVIFYEYLPRQSKAIIDKIDRLLAPHYHLTEQHLDHIINHDLKFRLGYVKEY